MKTIAFIFLTVISLNLFGENDPYTKKMKESIERFHSCTRAEEFNEVANQFRIISAMESRKWLPLYYEAHCYILMNFMDQSGPETKDAYLDRAGEAIDKMLELAPEESEVHALHAFCLTGRMVVNPPARAQTYAPQIGAAIGKSLALEPDNPRARYIKLSNDMGTAQFFGSDITTYCGEAKNLLEAWDSYPIKSQFHPIWGKELVQGLANSCSD